MTTVDEFTHRANQPSRQFPIFLKSRLSMITIPPAWTLGGVKTVRNKNPSVAAWNSKSETSASTPAPSGQVVIWQRVAKP